jgi:CheY-like chemotaxis protein
LRRGSGRRLTDWSRAGVHDCARDLEAKGTETILVVDDEELVRNLVKSLLESHGYKVLQAASGDAALDLISRYPHPLHLILTDVVMPGMNGRELADRLALLRPDLKILYMSANPRDILAQGNEPGSSPAYLQKPFTVEALLMRVRSLLDQSGPG